VRRAVVWLGFLACLAPPAQGSSPHPEASVPEGKGASSVTVLPRDRDDRGFDCLDLRLEIRLDFDTRTVLASAHHRIRATQALSELLLDLVDSLTVDGVWRGAVPAPFAHAGRVLQVTLTPPLAPGEQTTIGVTYHGRPPYDGLLGLSFQTRDGVPAVYTLSEPSSASAWWPCKDTPDDKLTSTLVIDVPDTLYAGSNGALVDDSAANGRRRMTWRESYPIAPYLISIACTNYRSFDGSHTGPNGQILPLLYLAYPEDLDDAQASWANTPAMIGAFEGRFGPYPFYGDKYGMAEFSWGGAMENQTLSSMGEYYVDGTTANDRVVAHELAHQWWGDMVTPTSWDHIWLNEGFASYAEALWSESQGGIEAYRDAMRGMWRPSFPGAIVPPNYIFNSTVYLKGAWILHMLRGVVGEEVFFGALRVYGERHAYGNAATEELIAAFEEVSGRDLRWFFDPWVYGPGRPVYFTSYEIEPGPEGAILSLTISQAQDEPPFRMPIEFGITDAAGSYRVTVLDSLRIQTFRLPVRLPPQIVDIDPDDWILKDSIGGSGAPDGTAGIRPAAAPWPSPGAPPFRIPLDPAAGDRTVEVFDMTGRRVASVLPAGASAAVWDGRDQRGRDLPSGLYLIRSDSPRGQARRLWIVR
jgi:aminopeptidase N